MGVSNTTSGPPFCFLFLLLKLCCTIGQRLLCSLFSFPLFSTLSLLSCVLTLLSLFPCDSDDGGQLEPIDGRLVVEMLDSNGCYVLDALNELYVWVGKNSSKELRNQASTLGDKQFAERADRAGTGDRERKERGGEGREEREVRDRRER